MLGDRVIVHGGANIGCDGFGFARVSHVKIPQIGRVILQADVEIGGNTVIDRGALGTRLLAKAASSIIWCILLIMFKWGVIVSLPQHAL